MQMTDDANGVGDRAGHDKPNQFDNLCDGVLNNLALVHGAMGEVKYTDCFRRMNMEVNINILGSFFYKFH